MATKTAMLDLEIKTANGKKAKKDKPERLTIASPSDFVKIKDAKELLGSTYSIKTMKVVKNSNQEDCVKVPVVDIAIAISQQIENLQGELAEREGVLRIESKTAIDKAFAEKTFVKTVDIEGSVAKIQVQFQDRYTPLAKEMEEPLKKIYADKFPIMFTVETNRMLKQEKFEELKALLGDRYDAFFEETTVVKPTKEFSYNNFLMQDTFTADQKATVQKIVDTCQSSPAVKYPK